MNLETQVGRPFSTRAMQRDVNRLWQTGRFEDIQVEMDEKPAGTAVVFKVLEAPRVQEVLIEPSSFGLHLTLPEGAPLSGARVHEIVLQARKQLSAQGYMDARVDSELVPRSSGGVDLRLRVRPGDRVRVKDFEFTGNLGLAPDELRGALRTIRIRRVFPRTPGLWGGWQLHPAYSQEALQSDLARLRSLYVSKGYLDASVDAEHVPIRGGDARIQFAVQAGPLYRRPDGGLLRPGDLCSSLFAQRREAERQGILDFSATLRPEPTGSRGTIEPVAELAVEIDRGQPYRVGRISFTGSRHYSEGLLRRNFVLEESGVFDRRLLRESTARLNRTLLFEPIDESNIDVVRTESTGIADLTVRLTERKRGSWGLSGPMGPMSFAGPLQAWVGSRLPSWGQGILELSTYTASLSVLAYARPVLAFLPGERGILPVLAVQRPFTPGEGWKSGFAVAPQLGWQRSVLNYAATQIDGRLAPILAAGRQGELMLPVAVERPQGDMLMICEPPKPRLAWLRRTASLSIQVLTAIQALY